MSSWNHCLLTCFYFCDFLKQKTDDCEWRSIFVLVDVPVCIYQSNRPSWGSQSSLSHTTVNSNRCTSWDCASSFIFIPLPVNSLKRVITPPQTTQSPLRLDLSFSFLLHFIVSSLGAIAAHTTWYRHPHPGQHRCAQCNFCVGLKPESCSQTLKPSPPTIKSSCHCIWNSILYCLIWRFIFWRPPGFIFPRSNLNSSVGYESKIRLGGIMIKRSPEEQHEGCSELLPDSRNRVQRKKTDIERSTESQVMKYTCSI